MCTNRIIIAISALAVACCAHAQGHSTQRLSGHELTEVKYAEERISMPGDTLSIDSLVEVRTLEVRTFIDTLRTVTLREDTVILPIDSSSRKGHYVQVHLGAGIGNVGYGFLRKDLVFPNIANSMGNCYEATGISGVVQLQYAYFFHQNVGIGVGAWLSNYTSHGHLLSGNFVYPDMKDSDDKEIDGTTVKPDTYTHHTDVLGWHERQTMHTVGLPVSLQFQAWGKQGKAGFFGSLGVAPAFTVKSNYRVLNGKIAHWGEYPQLDAEIREKYGFGTKPANNAGKLNVKQISAAAFVDLGLLVRLSKQIDLLIGVYGQYGFTNVQAIDSLTNIGWKDKDFPNLDVAEYNGILASNCIAGTDGKGQLHPWQAGVKIGLHWHSWGKPRKQITQFNDTTLQMVERYDSVWTTRVDTIHNTRVRTRETVQKRIDRLNRIYFDFNSYELAQDSKQALDEIAEYLLTVPNKIVLGGHASKEGSAKHNEKLAMNRALAVKKYLVSRGVSAKRMTIKDYGSSVSNALNLSDNLSLDRRVEIIVQDE